MTAYYKHNPKFYVGIDCIIFGFDKGERRTESPPSKEKF